MGAGRFATPLAIACAEFCIDNDLEFAHFLAQLAHESVNFERTVESLNYSVEGLLRTFSRKRISAEDCARYGRKPGQAANQVMIATKVYGGPWGRINLGNELMEDGYKFRGRSLIQTTGRANYLATSRGLFNDDRLLSTPDLLAQDPTVIARAACWFWANKKCKGAALRDDCAAVTLIINGKAMHGLAERQKHLNRIKKIMGLP